MPDDVRAKLPGDGADQHDHYIYLAMDAKVAGLLILTTDEFLAFFWP